MNTFIKKIVIFVLILIILNVFFYFLLIKFHSGSKKVNELVDMKDENYELIAFGNSMTMDGFDSKLVSDSGISAYNLALGGAHISTTFKTLKYYLANNNKPKILLLGLASAAGKSYLNPYPYSSPELDYYLNYSLIEKISNPPMYHFQWAFLEMIKLFFSSELRKSYFSNGQWRSNKTIEDNSKYVYQENMNEIPQSVYLDSIWVICKNKGIKLILVDFPGSRVNRNKLPSEYYVTINNSDSIKIYNFNNYIIADTIVSPKDHWLSPNHLNQMGANSFTRFLFPLIKK